MKRSVAALLTLGLIAGGVAAGTLPASAAPPTDPWSASATSNTAGVSVTAAAVTVGAQVAQSTSAASSTATPRTSATTQNVAAAVGPLGIGVQSATATAGPTAGSQTTPVGIGASVGALLTVGALTGSTEATWNGDTACVAPPQGLSSTTTTTAATSLAPGLVLGGSLASIGASTTNTSTGLQGLSGSLFGVASQAFAGPVTTSLLNGAVEVQVTGTTSLQTVSNGTGTASVNYSPGTVRVTGPLGFDQTLTTGSPTATVGVVGVGSVTVTLNTVSNTSSGTAGAASVSLATISVSAIGIASANIDLLPLSVAAAAPAGGIDCAPPAPVISSPTSGATTGPTPTITGTALPNTPVTVTVDSTVLAPVTSDGTGAFSVVSPALATGSHTVSATQSSSGFTSPTSNVVTFSVDATPPGAPVILTPPSPTTTSDATPAFTGTTPADSASVTLTATPTGGGAPIVTGPFAPTGTTWATDSSTLPDGTYTVTAVATDAVGNVSAPSNAVTITVDTAAPNPPVITSPATGTTTNDSTPAVGGTMDAGTTQIILTATPTSGSPVVTGPIAVTGTTWGFDTQTLPDGTYTLTAVGRDAAGNTSGTSNAVTITIDTAAPAAPVITSPTSGTQTNDPTPPVTGTMEAGTTSITLSAAPTSGAPIVTGPIAVSGTTWSFDSATLPDGTYTLTAVGTDAGGNTSPQSNAVTLIVDTVAPPAPVITEPTNGTETSDSTPAVGGTGVDGTTVVVTATPTVGSPVVSAPTPVAGGIWLLDMPTLADGPYVLSAVATDAAGNTSPVSNLVAIVVDTVAPAPPVITSPLTGTTTSNPRPPISGTAGPGAQTVNVIVDGIIIGAAPVTAGLWTLTPLSDLAEGLRTITATAVDAAGNPSGPSAPVVITIDRTAPAAPVILTPATGTTTADTTPAVGGTMESGTVAITVTATPTLGPAVVTGPIAVSGTTWSLDSATLSDGTWTLQAVGQDAAGNSSGPSNAVTITVDTTAPAAPVITSPLNGTVTDDGTPAVSGTQPADTATITLTATPTVGSPIVTGPIAVTGTTWGFDSATLPDGTYVLTAVGTDAAGNASGPSNAVTITVDTVAPAPPVITSPTDGSTVTNPRPPIIGTADPGATSVTVYVDGVIAGTAPVAAGSWTFTPTSDLAEGDRTITATARDAADNVSGPSAPVVITVDALPPGQPVITAPANGSTTNSPNITAVVQTEPGATVDFELDGTPVGSSVADGSGVATLPLPTLSDGSHTLIVTASDGGGTSVPSAPVTFAVDTAAPPAPVITSPTPGSTTGPQPPVTGTSEPGTTVVIIIDGNPAGTGTTGGDGTFTITPTQPLADGDHVVRAVATDAAGNASAPSAAVAFRSAGARGLAATGADLSVAVPAGAGILLVLGAGLLLAARRRRAER